MESRDQNLLTLMIPPADDNKTKGDKELCRQGGSHTMIIHFVFLRQLVFGPEQQSLHIDLVHRRDMPFDILIELPDT